jgi:cytochrome b involved in lipid metabolism
MVLDVTQFLDNHPGGKFSLNHNIGRDISKFFYGGYSLEKQENSKVENHVHSNDARRIVNTLIIGKLERDASYRVMSTTPYK